MDISAYPVYNLEGNSFDEASNVLKRMEMLYVDQKQVCDKFYAENQVGFRLLRDNIEVLTLSNVNRYPGTFICHTNMIYKGN